MVDRIGVQSGGCQEVERSGVLSGGCQVVDVQKPGVWPGVKGEEVKR